MKEDELILRKLLWLSHGCGYGSLYGDDGEMQCNKCGIDFKRDSVKEIKEKFQKIATDKLKKYEKEIVEVEDKYRFV